MSAETDERPAAEETQQDIEVGDQTRDGHLILENVTKTFGGLTAVDRLSFSVRYNEILGFIGPNGAGKSTTFNCVTGVFPPTSGQIIFDGDDITGHSMHGIVQRGIGRTFQTFRPLNDRTVLENIMLPLTNSRIFSLGALIEADRERAIEIAEQTGLEDRMHQTPNELPHGDIVRLEIARALGTDPELLLVDEPFAGLTGDEIAELSSLFNSLQQDGLTLVVVDHNMRGLLTLVNRVVVIQFGEKIAEGTPDEVTQMDVVQEAYLGNET